MSTTQSLDSKLIGLLATELLDLPQTALVADLVAADARFNYWFATDGKRLLSRDRLLEILDTYEDLWSECCEAVDVFVATGDSSLLEATLHKTLTMLAASDMGGRAAPPK